MKSRIVLAALVVVGAAATSANAAIVTFTPNAAGNYVDMFYTVNADSQFTNWDLVVQPTVGSILDPNKGQKSFNAQSGAAPLDTFANTVFSAVGAGAAQYVHTKYNPGQAFPPIPADPEPSAGGTPDALNWTIFDTAEGDGNIAGFFPYHMARIMFSQGGRGVISASMFDTKVLGVPETFSFTYGGAIVPEPASIAMGAMGLLGLLAIRRK